MLLCIHVMGYLLVLPMSPEMFFSRGIRRVPALFFSPLKALPVGVGSMRCKVNSTNAAVIKFLAAINCHN